MPHGPGYVGGHVEPSGPGANHLRDPFPATFSGVGLHGCWRFRVSSFAFVGLLALGGLGGGGGFVGTSSVPVSEGREFVYRLTHYGTTSSLA